MLEPENRTDVRIAEEQVLDFVVHLHSNMSRGDSTISSHLYAIRRHHEEVGAPNPLARMTRLWLAVKGIRNVRGATSRKHPVTPAMMKWIRDQLDLDKPDDAVVWASLCTAYFFLLRSSEYSQHPGKGEHVDKIIRGCDLALQRAGAAARIEDLCDELILRIRGSKVDQVNAGAVRNHYKSGDPSGLCPVASVEALRRHFPGRFEEGEESLKPAFRLADGSTITRTRVVGMLTLAAIALGLDADRVGSHSLRIGGACALYNQFRDLELVRRFGRWASTAFHVYLWEAREPVRGVSAGMARNYGSLMASQGLGADLNRRGVNFAI